MYPFAQVPAHGGKSSSITDHERRVRLWKQSEEVDPPKRASPLILQMETIARQVYMKAVAHTFMQGEGAETILLTLRNYFQPGALGHVYQQLTKCLQRKRTDQTLRRYLL